MKKDRVGSDAFEEDEVRGIWLPVTKEMRRVGGWLSDLAPTAPLRNWRPMLSQGEQAGGEPNELHPRRFTLMHLALGTC